MQQRQPDDVVRRVGKEMVIRRRSAREANAWARRYCQTGHAQRLGIALDTEGEIDGVVCATMFWTTDGQEAEVSDDADRRFEDVGGSASDAWEKRGLARMVVREKETGNLPEGYRR